MENSADDEVLGEILEYLEMREANQLKDWAVGRTKKDEVPKEEAKPAEE